MGDFLRFETMITPVLIQVIFWLAVVIAIIAGIVRIGHGGAGGIAEGIALIILGPILARIYAELLIVWFRIFGHLRQIDRKTGHA
ncbi:MAG: DUF4282 domain-containing protein [Stellaceae bacterium]